jgi:hypothetical protein
MNKRPFGVEIECGSNRYSYYDVEQLLCDNGLENWAEMEVDCDGSGIEIRSPILVGRKGMNELEKVFNLLNENNFYTGREDGMHVHHDVSDLDVEDIHRIAVSWYNNQNHIHTMVDRYRVENRWCPALRVSDLEMIEREIAHKRSGTNDNVLDYYHPNRVCYEKYRALSLNARQYHDTIEIRLHEGTLNFERAKAWIQFGQTFISRIAEKHTEPIEPKKSLRSLFAAIKPYKAAREYYLSPPAPLPLFNDAAVREALALENAYS